MTQPDELAELAEHYHQYGEQLRRAVAAACPGWLAGVIDARLPGASGDAGVQQVMQKVASEVDTRLAVLASADVDEPLSGPLETIRSCLAPIVELLEARGVDPAESDVGGSPVGGSDRHDLGPMRFDDLSPQVHEAGIAWGAAKAFLHRARRRAESTSGEVD